MTIVFQGCLLRARGWRADNRDRMSSTGPWSLNDAIALASLRESRIWYAVRCITGFVVNDMVFNGSDWMNDGLTVIRENIGFKT